jgi:hypothetical protein
MGDVLELAEGRGGGREKDLKEQKIQHSHLAQEGKSSAAQRGAA